MAMIVQFAISPTNTTYVAQPSWAPWEPAHGNTSTTSHTLWTNSSSDDSCGTSMATLSSLGFFCELPG